ncbi:MAG TPA: DciA family protein [Nocardioides sp.]|nr:DciA family protein [Nocardioides sp.]
MAEDEPDPATEPQPPEQHAEDGLDLARALTRASARSTPTKRSSRKATTGRRPPTSRSSGAHPDERDPQPLDVTVGRIVDDHGWDLNLRVQGVFARWAEIVGAEIAAHTTPETFADGKLVVRTDSTAWATQLKLLAPSVVRRLNEDLGHGTVTVIDILGPHGPSWKKGPRSVRDGRGPRDTYG